MSEVSAEPGETSNVVPARGRQDDATPEGQGGPRLVAESRGLAADNLGKQFKQRPVLRDVSLNVRRGEAVGLLGPNGAGKTTCFYMIVGLVRRDGGSHPAR